MSLLQDIRRRLLGQQAMVMPGQGMGGATQGLIGTGGEIGGGLLQQNLNQMNTAEGGLLNNIPQSVLLGAALYGQGMKGKDPLEGFFPAVTQSAQLQRLMTPKAKKPFAVTNKETGEPELITLEQYNANPGKYVPDQSTTAAMKDYKELEKIMATGTPEQKKIAKMVFAKGGREPISKSEFLSKAALTFSKDVALDQDAINEKLKNFGEIYDTIFGAEQLPKNFKGTSEQWSNLKSANPNATDEQLIEFFNKKYGG